MNATDNKKVPEKAGGRNSGTRNHQNSAAETDSSADERSSGKKETNVRFDEWWTEYAEKMGARFDLDAQVAA